MMLGFRASCQITTKAKDEGIEAIKRGKFAEDRELMVTNYDQMN